MVAFVENNFCIEMPNQQAYDIHVSTCKTHSDLVAWIKQLTEKSWVTTDDIHGFINVFDLVNCENE